MLKIPTQYTSLNYVKPLSWEDVFDTWRKGEARQKFWKKHWKSRGFSSWDEWRKEYARPLKTESLEWFLFEIKNPLKDLPLFYGVPSKTWIKKAYKGEKTKILSDIVNLTMVSKHPKVIDMQKDFPKETMLTGLVYDNKIIIIEGMHRACALASWKASNNFTGVVKIALAVWLEKEIPLIGGNSKS